MVGGAGKDVLANSRTDRGSAPRAPAPGRSACPGTLHVRRDHHRQFHRRHGCRIAGDHPQRQRHPTATQVLLRSITYRNVSDAPLSWPGPYGSCSPTAAPAPPSPEASRLSLSTTRRRHSTSPPRWPRTRRRSRFRWWLMTPTSRRTEDDRLRLRLRPRPGQTGQAKPIPNRFSFGRTRAREEGEPRMRAVTAGPALAMCRPPRRPRGLLRSARAGRSRGPRNVGHRRRAPR